MRIEPVPEKQVAGATWTHNQSTGLLLELLDGTIRRMQDSLYWSSMHALGDEVFTVAANDTVTAERLTRCLLPAGPRTAKRPHLQIFVCTASAAPFLMPPPWNLPHTDPRHLERLHLSPDGKLSASYDQDRECWMILDMNTRRALLWIADAGKLPEWEHAAPFRQLLQWSMVETGLSMLHAGAAAHAGRGVLLVGPGGSGKSTTVAACFQAGMGVCGDDLVIASRSMRGWRVQALYNAIKLLPDAAIAAPPLLKNAPWSVCGDKRLVRYSDVRPDALIRSIPLQGLMHCRVSGNDVSRIVPITPAKMLQAAAPSTVFMLRGRESHILKEANTLVRSLPCLRLELGKNPAEAVARIRLWLEKPAHNSNDV